MSENEAKVAKRDYLALEHTICIRRRAYILFYAHNFVPSTFIRRLCCSTLCRRLSLRWIESSRINIIQSGYVSLQMYQEGWLHVCASRCPGPMVHSLPVSASWKDYLDHWIWSCHEPWSRLKPIKIVFIVAWSKTVCDCRNKSEAVSKARYRLTSKLYKRMMKYSMLLREQSE